MKSWLIFWSTPVVVVDLLGWRPAKLHVVSSSIQEVFITQALILKLFLTAVGGSISFQARHQYALVVATWVWTLRCLPSFWLGGRQGLETGFLQQAQPTAPIVIAGRLLVSVAFFGHWCAWALFEVELQIWSGHVVINKFIIQRISWVN